MKKLTAVQKKQLIIFFAIAFGCNYLMGAFMAYGKSIGKDISSFVMAQMMYPACGVAVAMLVTKAENILLPKNFYKGYVYFTVITVAAAILGLFLPFDMANNVVIIGSLVLLVIYFKEKKESRKSYALGPWNGKRAKGIWYILLFFTLYLVPIFLPIVVGEQSLSEVFSNPQGLIILALLPFNFFLSYIVFFGEEYGWRAFLQPLMQKVFGIKIGLLVVGVLWGIWHLPVNIFYYSPQTWGLSILNQQVICIIYSIFFGFVYMKTKNIWIPVIMHYINNNFIAVLAGNSAIQNQVLNLKGIVGSLIIMTILYVPVIFLIGKNKIPTIPMNIEEKEIERLDN